MSEFWLRRAVVSAQFVFLMLMIGCSSQPRLGPIATGEKLSISPPTSLSNTTDKISNDAIKSDAKTGAGGGAVAGAAWGLACGPLAIACVPIAALAGAVVGGTTGAIVGSARGLSDEQADQLNQNVSAYIKEHDPSILVHEFLVSRASKEWIITEKAPDADELHIEISEIYLNSEGKDQISLTIVVRAELSSKDFSGKQRVRSGKFDYQSPGSPAMSWIGNHNDFIARRFDDGYLTLTENIVASMLRGSR